MPLTWSQVKSDLDPAKYTVRTVPALLRKSKAWLEYCDAERPLEQAIRKLNTQSSGLAYESARQSSQEKRTSARRPPRIEARET